MGIWFCTVIDCTSTNLNKTFVVLCVKKKPFQSYFNEKKNNKKNNKASLQYRAYCFQSFPVETNLLSQKETRKHWPVILVCYVCRLSRMALPPLLCPNLLPPALPCITAQPQPAEEGRGVRRAPAFPLAEAAAGNRGWWCTRTPPCR